MADEQICAYCGEPTLTGDEDPEHAVPAAIAGRLTTTAVCIPCNRWAGLEVDQPWLDDPLVLDCRFKHAIRDRRGRTVDSSPLLTGSTADGRRVTMGRDGKPVLQNAPVHFDEATGVMRITAADEEALRSQTERQLRKRGIADASATPLESRSVSDHPEISGGGEVVPGRWYRMGAKVALALLAEQQPPAWRRGESAQRLRTAMRRPKPQHVQFLSLETVRAFAPEPATSVLLSKPGPTVLVSLMGIFAVAFSLVNDLDRTDWGWVADPLDVSADAEGSLARVIYARHLAAGLLEGPSDPD